MSGLREKTKKKNKKKIIQSAKKLFMNKGVQKTSIAEIANDAEVGTGTIYNYFSSKGAILLAILLDDFAKIKKDNQVVRSDDGNLVEEIMQPIEGLSIFFDQYTKPFWREFMQLLPSEVENGMGMLHGVVGLDAEVIRWMKQIIEKHSDSFLVPVNSEEAATAIYGIGVTQTLLFIYDETITYEQFIERLTSQIHFIFSGKIKG